MTLQTAKIKKISITKLILACPDNASIEVVIQKALLRRHCQIKEDYGWVVKINFLLKCSS